MGEAQRKKDAGIYFGMPGYVKPEQPTTSGEPEPRHGDRRSARRARMFVAWALSSLPGSSINLGGGGSTRR